MNTFIIKDDIVFEGLTRPESIRLFYDNGADLKYEHVDKGEMAVLERYFADVQNLFLKKFALFAGTDMTQEQETHKLRSLLEEMIKVKSLMEKISSDTD